MSYFRPNIDAMSGYIPGEQPQGSGYIKLNTNENPYAASPRVAEAIGEAIAKGLQRYPDPMAGVFRQAAGSMLGVPPEWILAGNGSDDILTIVTRALVGEGDTLRLPYPSYILYRTLAELQGARFEEIEYSGTWVLPPQFAEPCLRPGEKLRLVFLPNPNSPTGTIVSPEAVLDLARRLPCPLLVDEAYADFAEASCAPLVAQCDKLMVSKSLSKSYALAGLRFGYLVAQPHMIEQFVKVKDSYNCDALSIAAATAAIGDQAWLAETRSKIVATRARLFKEMRSLGFIGPESRANFLWCLHSRRAIRSIYEELKDRKILVRYMVYPNWSDGVRISIGTDAEIDTLLDAVGEMVEKLYDGARCTSRSENG